MTSDRFVLLGLARPRAPWFAELSRWATTATIPAEFVKCVSSEELRVRLASGRPWSAVLLDGTMPAVDRDLIAAARDAGCPAIVVDEREGAQRWRAVGAAGVLPGGFDRGALVELLDAMAVTVGRPLAVPPGELDPSSGRGAGIVVAVCGPGGTGSSMSAAALAQGLAASGRSTLLADLARHAEQAALHDVRDVVPGVQELVEAHRNGVPTADDIRSLTFSVVDRGYALLLGLRRARYWPALRPRAFAAAFDSLRRSFDAVVCDVTADFEGEADAGSADVEERNLAGRTSVAEADVVVVVGRPGVKGIHSLVRARRFSSVGVPAGSDPARRRRRARGRRAHWLEIAAVRSRRSPARAGRFRCWHRPCSCLRTSRTGAAPDGTALPGPLPAPSPKAVLAVHDHVGPVVRHVAQPVPIVAGSLGTFTDN